MLKNGPQPDAATGELRDRVLEHLLQWAEDGLDVSMSRSDAVGAVRILADVLPEEERASAFMRMVALHDNPQLNPMDQRDQESLHPLSRFRFDMGSEELYLECLFAAAVLAQSDEEWEQVWRRVTAGMTNPELGRGGAYDLAQ